VGVLHHEIVLSLSAGGREGGEVEQVDSRLLQGGEDTHSFAGLVGNLDVAIVHATDLVGHRCLQGLQTSRADPRYWQEGPPPLPPRLLSALEVLACPPRRAPRGCLRRSRSSSGTKPASDSASTGCGTSSRYS